MTKPTSRALTRVPRDAKPMKLGNKMKVLPIARDFRNIAAIYRIEGADACLSCCKEFGLTRSAMLLLLVLIERK